MMLTTRHVALFTLFSLAGCAGSPAVTRAADSSDLTVEEAHRLVTAYEQRRATRAQSANDPLRNPKSLDDVLEVLRRDQIDLFPESVKFATGQQGAQALALRAQIELAWGEGQHILADLLHRASHNLRTQAGLLERKGHTTELSAAEKQELQTLQSTLRDLAGIGDALTRVGGQHIAQGATLARLVIDQAPADYHGYRVAADYYRLREDWAGFDSMVKKIEAAQPNSNGLVFLRGMEALHRKNDPQKAAELFREALHRDPKFARAQVQLLLAQPDTEAAYVEFEKLRALNPSHQVVVWAGPAIAGAHETFVARQRRTEQRREDQAQSLPTR